MLPDTNFPADLRTFGRDYELIREIGQGGMAAVYLARHRSTGTLVAIKAIRARYIDDPDALQRFAREARTVADLDHPNIVRTIDIEQIDDRAVAIISEYIAGGTLRDRLRAHGAFAADEAERVLRDVAQALGYAHGRGIVHRDVKPENVFLDERTGRALLADFGIARRIEGDVSITVLGSALGTPQYMSPEQVDGSAIDGRSDIYSLGVLGWELLTGRVPWAGESLYSIIYKQKHDELPPIMSLRPRVPANLRFVIERAMMKNRERRWQSIEELLAHLTYDPTAAGNFPTLEFRRPPPEPEPIPPPNADAVAAPPRSLSVDPASEREPKPRSTDTAPGLVGPRRTSPPWTRPSRTLAGLALLITLAIAGGTLYSVLGGVGHIEPDRDSPGVLTSSGGNVTLDTASAVHSGSSTATAAPPPAVPVDRPNAETATSVASAPRNSAPLTKAPTTNASKANSRVTKAPATNVPARTAPAKSAPVPSASPRKSATRAAATTGITPAPSPRCRVASMADQRACLLAYITVNDAPLQRAYDSLILELRRAAGVRRRAPDPPSVTRLRAEQRTWIAVRDRECTRKPAPGYVPYWAEPLSKCFADRSASRTRELRASLRRLRQAR